MATDYLPRVCVDLAKSICFVSAAMFAHVHCLYCVCVNFAKGALFASCLCDSAKIEFVVSCTAGITVQRGRPLPIPRLSHWPTINRVERRTIPAAVHYVCVFSSQRDAL